MEPKEAFTLAGLSTKDLKRLNNEELSKAFYDYLKEADGLNGLPEGVGRCLLAVADKFRKIESLPFVGENRGRLCRAIRDA